MGCFSVSCCLSNLPIYSQRIGVMLLKLDAYCKKEFPFDKNFICSNEASGVFFKPASPIIWGKCNTYGNIEDITIDEGFIWTCKEVLKIEPTEEAFSEWVKSDWMGNPSDGIYITFFLEDVVKQAIEFSRERNSAYNYYCQHWVLEKFPQFFKLEETLDKNKERYNLIYSIVGSNKRIASDERWIHGVNNKHGGFYKTKDLLKWIDIPEITETIMSTEVGTMYDIILQEKYNIARIMARISGGINFPLETTFPEELHQSNVDIMLLGSYMFEVNRYYAPVFSGPQHNKYDAIKHLLKLSTDIVEKELAQGDDD